MTDTPQSPDNAQELEPVAWRSFSPINPQWGSELFRTKESADESFGSSVEPLYSQATVDGLIKERDALLVICDTTQHQYRASCARISELQVELATARNDAIKECANIAFRACAETRHVTLGNKAATEIRNLKVDT